MMHIWHALSEEETIHILRANVREGLSEKEVLLRRRSHGMNAIERARHWIFIRLLINQLSSPLVLLLCAAGVVLLLLGDKTDALIVALVLSINTIIGIIQEGRASRAFEELAHTVQKRSRVLRDGSLKEIDSVELVPGDIIEIEAGMSIDADARILEAWHLKINEASLTGEWIAQEKGEGELPEHTPLADRANMLYAGTLVEEGSVRAVVTATGHATELGRIASLLEDTLETPTPFQKTLAKLSHTIGAGVILIAGFLFIIGVMRGETPQEMFLVAVALAVSAVPEGLPIATTVILALGMERILKKGGLLRRLKSAETLGSTTVILTDKTGTLTEGTPEVSHLIPVVDTEHARNQLLLGAILASNAFVENLEAELSEWRARGEPIGKALVSAGIAAGITKQQFEVKHARVDYFPFDPHLRIGGEVYKERDHYLIFASGAPEAIIARSNLGSEKKKSLLKKYEEYAREGIRLIACGKTTWKGELADRDKIFLGFEFLGLVGFHDPLRASARDAIHTAIRAGIRPVIVTGDHHLTAQRIARELDFDGEPKRIFDGGDTEKDSFDVREADIIARVLPHQKSLIVEAWQKRGEVVAMTGDGVNDAPALKRADIGIALGSGTDTAKEAADLVLLDNSFETIIAAVEEGRTIIDNMRKVVTFLLATGFTEVILISSSLVLGLPLPLLPAQILWMNLVGEGFFNFAFAFEKKERDVILEKPTRLKHFFTREMKALIFIGGLINDLLLLGLYMILLQRGVDIGVARTIVFSGLAINAFFFVFSLRSFRRPLWRIHPFSNPYLLFAFAASMLLLIPPLVFKPLQSLLHLVPITFGQFQIVILIGVLDLVCIEAIKYHFISRHRVLE